MVQKSWNFVEKKKISVQKSWNFVERKKNFFGSKKLKFQWKKIKLFCYKKFLNFVEKKKFFVQKS